jgi:hypothetical protein
VSFIENILAEYVGEHIGNNRIRKTPTPPTLPKRKKTIRCILAHFIWLPRICMPLFMTFFGLVETKCTSNVLNPYE